MSWFGIGMVGGAVFWQPAPGYAEIYKYTKNGVVYYTNQHPQQKSYKIIDKGTSLAVTVRTVKVTQKAPPQALLYQDIILKVATMYQLNPDLVKAIIRIESGFNKKAVSPKGARGLMQLMPATAERFGVNDVFDPEENITGGAKFLRYLFNEFGEENIELVLAGYNAGEEAVRQYGNKIPPYQETQAYVRKVLALYPFTLPSRKPSIFRYVDKNGVLAFTNIPRVMKQ